MAQQQDSQDDRERNAGIEGGLIGLAVGVVAGILLACYFNLCECGCGKTSTAIIAPVNGPILASANVEISGWRPYILAGFINNGNTEAPVTFNIVVTIDGQVVNPPSGPGGHSATYDLKPGVTSGFTLDSDIIYRFEPGPAVPITVTLTVSTPGAESQSYTWDLTSTTLPPCIDNIGSGLC